MLLFHLLLFLSLSFSADILPRTRSISPTNPISCCHLSSALISSMPSSERSSQPPLVPSNSSNASSSIIVISETPSSSASSSAIICTYQTAKFLPSTSNTNTSTPTDVKGVLHTHTLKSYLVSSSRKFAIALSLVSQLFASKRMDPSVSPKVSTCLSVAVCI